MTATDGSVSATAIVMVTDASTTVKVRVSANTDDAEEAASGGMYIGSSDLELTLIQEMVTRPGWTSGNSIPW